MQVIDHITYYTLNEVLLRLFAAAVKERFGNAESQDWQYVLYIAGLIPSKMDKELLSAIEADEEAIAPLRKPNNAEMMFMAYASSVFRLSDTESYLDSAEHLLQVAQPNILLFLTKLKADSELSSDQKEQYIAIKKTILLVFGNAENLALLQTRLRQNPDIDKADLESIFAANLPTENIGLIYLLICLLECISATLSELCDLQILHEKLFYGEINAYGVRFPLLKSKPEITPIDTFEWQYMHFNVGEFPSKGEVIQAIMDRGEYSYRDLLFTVPALPLPDTIAITDQKRGKKSRMDYYIQMLKDKPELLKPTLRQTAQAVAKSDIEADPEKKYYHYQAESIENGVSSDGTRFRDEFKRLDRLRK